MIINNDLCVKCKICVAECPQIAVFIDDENDYFINKDLCDECIRLFDKECVRVCKFNAVVNDDGTLPDSDPILRVRPEHIIWAMALMASRGYTDDAVYMIGQPQWNLKRRMIADAYLDPDFKVRLTEIFDDICVGCAAKQEIGHMDHIKSVDNTCFEILDIKPGTVVKFWDVVKLIEERFSAETIKSLNPMPDRVFNDFLNFLSPGAKALESM